VCACVCVCVCTRARECAGSHYANFSTDVVREVLAANRENVGMLKSQLTAQLTT